MKRSLFALIVAGLTAVSHAQPPADAKAAPDLDAARAQLAQARKQLQEMEQRLAQREAELRLGAMRQEAERLQADAVRKQALAAQDAAQAELRARTEADYGRRIAEAARQSLTEKLAPKADVLKPAPVAEGKPMQFRVQFHPKPSGEAPSEAKDVFVFRKPLTLSGSPLTPDAGATPLVRRTHAVGKEKAEKLIAFFKEFAGDQILEAKFDKGGLETTTTPELDQLLAGLVALSNGKKPARLKLGGDAPTREVAAKSPTPGGKGVPSDVSVSGQVTVDPKGGETGITLYYLRDSEPLAAEDYLELTNAAPAKGDGTPFGLKVRFAPKSPAGKPSPEVVPVTPKAK